MISFADKHVAKI